MNKKLIGYALAIIAALGASNIYASTVFQGQNANGTFDSSCTVNGPNQCVMYWDAVDGIEILNNWNIGTGTWSSTASAGSAQAISEAAGYAATGVTGWVLPTGDGRQPAGPYNLYWSIWSQLGNSLFDLRSQFAGVNNSYYWSRTENALAQGVAAWYFDAGNSYQYSFGQEGASYYAVAVHPGLITANKPNPVPLPASAWMLLSGLGGLGLLAKKRKGKK